MKSFIRSRGGAVGAGDLKDGADVFAEALEESPPSRPAAADVTVPRSAVGATGFASFKPVAASGCDFDGLSVANAVKAEGVAELTDAWKGLLLSGGSGC